MSEHSFAGDLELAVSVLIESAGPEPTTIRTGLPLDIMHTLLIKRLKADGTISYNRHCRECSRKRRRDWYETQVDHPVKHYGDTLTHCPQGHEYTPENTIQDKKGRRCRQCKLASTRKWKRKRKLEKQQKNSEV